MGPKIEKNFNVFHSKVNGLESKLDTLHTFLSSSKSALDVLAITETSENDSTSFLSNVNIDGFKPPFHTPTLSSKGGTALYINKDFDSYERLDLKVQNVNFESVWVQ